MRPIEEQLLECLVDGELADAERRALLVRLDREPDGWRRCALAFLQEQTWREAIAPLANGASTPASPALTPPASRQRISWRRAARMTALAAGLAAAFTIGWTLRERPTPSVPAAPLAEVKTGVPKPSLPPSRPGPFDVAGHEARPSNSDQQASLLDPVLRRWEQQGYRAETQKRLVSMELKDGRKIQLPIQEVRLRYVGDRTY